jgi:hypothetical protein
MQGEGNCEDWGLICGGLGLGREEMPAAGLCPRPVREKGFPSNLLLDLIDASPLFK